MNGKKNRLLWSLILGYFCCMLVLDGKIAAAAVKASLQKQTAAIAANGKRAPHLAAILVGNNGASETYVASKVKNCEETGFLSSLIRLDENVSEEILLDTIQKLNKDNTVDGILVQLPLPKHISDQKVIEAIDPKKDVDGFHPVNVGKLVQGLETFIPATPYGIMLLLEHFNIDTKGKHAVVVGRSNIVGRPMSILMSRKGWPGNSTVTLTHSNTKNITQIISQADIVISALGVPNFLKAEMVKDDAVIIDVGITRVEDLSKPKGYRIVGDVDFDGVSKKASFITPVPGGVGPMTIAMLLKNTLLAREQRAISKN